MITRSYPSKFPIPETFWETESPRRFFLVLRDKKISGEGRDIPFLSMNFFDKSIFLKNEGFPYELFRYCEKINFRQNRDTPSYAFFYSTVFPKHKDPLRNFSVQWDKKFATQNRDAPLLHENFRYQKVSETQSCSFTNFSGTVSQKNFDGKKW